MSVTGIALVLFLTFHACMNVVALFSEEGYNWICEMLGANWYAVAATVGLAGLVLIHFIYAFWLNFQNRKARGNNRYEVTDKPEKVEWASQNMLVLGIIICLGLCLHLYNFWWHMMAAELIEGEYAQLATDGVYWIRQTFSCPVYAGLYLVWLCALLVPSDPRHLERNADNGLERQGLVPALALHRQHLCNPRCADVRSSSDCVRHSRLWLLRKQLRSLNGKW